MLKSPLHDCFAAAGAVFDESAGYAVAMRTAGTEQEANAIRHAAGIWDHSDMAKIKVTGDGARHTLGRTVTGDVDMLPENAIRYTLVLDDQGAVVADVQIYNNFDEYLVTCDAAAKSQVLQALENNNDGNAAIQDVTAEYAAICVEGPQAWRVPNALGGLDAQSLRLLNFAEVGVNGGKAILSRIGYCGEYGYILFIPPHSARQSLETMQKCLADSTLCGREVQDLLRLEVRSFNARKDIPNGESPLEAGLHWMIHFRKDEFTGRDAVLAERDRGLSKRMVAFELANADRATGLGPIRDGDDEIGYAANHDFSSRRNRTIGLAYLNEPYGCPGLALTIDTDAGRLPIRTVSSPFVVTESNKVQAS